MKGRGSVKAAIYARVSTTDQNCEMQLTELREYAARRAWEIVNEFVDTGWSGAKASRPEFDKLMQDAGKRRFDVVLCWKLDRFGRSLLNCKAALQELQSYGVRFIATSQNIDTDESNPAARFLLHILMAAAEFERELIRERAAAGLKRYRQEYRAGKVGKTVSSRSGRNMPPHRPRKVFDREEVVRLRHQGQSYRQIAKSLGLGIGTVVRTLQAGSKSSLRPFRNATAGSISQYPSSNHSLDSDAKPAIMCETIRFDECRQIWRRSRCEWRHSS
jgi:DNA invertase Pin-like site-specific DNA recombinase